MATQTQTQTTEAVAQRPTVDPLNVEYWAKQCIPPLKSLMNAVACYSAEDQEAQLRHLREHVLPNVGPRPSKAIGPSYITQSGNPIQLSVNASSGNCVRYCWEMLGPGGDGPRDPLAMEAAKDITASMFAAFGFSTKWSDVLLSSFALPRTEAQKVVDMLPQWIQNFVPEGVDAAPIKRVPFALTAFDLKGGSISAKLYVNPKAKEICTGTPAAGEIWDILRNLKPSFDHEAVNMLEKFFTDASEPCPIELVGIDCVDEARLSKARVKLYCHTRLNSFNTVRQYVTLQGRLDDDETKKGLDILRSIWHLLLQEPEGLANDDTEKPINESSIFCQKLYFSFELQPGQALPRVKTYLPTWNYVRSDEETIRNYEEAFRICGHPWGEGGKYGEIFTNAFGSAKHGREKPVHCDASYMYTEKQGVYQTLYFSTPLGEEEFPGTA